jgi:hypothetical protein
MSGRPLTMSDLLAVSGYTRDQMRGLLDAIPTYAVRDTKARIAKQYTAHDLLVLAACARLENRYGLQRATVAGFSEQLRQVLSGPRPISTAAHLLLTFEPPEVRYVEEPLGLLEGLLIPLPPIFQAVDEYLVPEHTRASWSQRELGFGPRAVNAASPRPPVESAKEAGTPPKRIQTSRRKL